MLEIIPEKVGGQEELQRDPTKGERDVISEFF